MTRNILKRVSIYNYIVTSSFEVSNAGHKRSRIHGNIYIYRERGGGGGRLNGCHVACFPELQI